MLSRFLGLCRLAVTRSLALPGLLSIRFFGMLVAVTLVAGVSLYSTAMGDAMLQANLGQDSSNKNIAVSVTNGPLPVTTHALLDSYVRHDEARDLGLPLHNLYVHHNTATVGLYRRSAFPATGQRQPLATLAVDYYDDFESHVRLVAGTLDVPAHTARGDAPVAISQYTAQTLGLHPGDRLVFSLDGHHQIGPTVMIAGIFVPLDVNSDFWSINAGVKNYRSLVALRLDTFQSIVTSNLFQPEYFWLYTTDLKAVRLDDANAILDRVHRVNARVADIAPGASLLTSLDININGFLYQYQLLPLILLILVTPILALVLYAVAVTSTLVLDRQAGEIVLLRSRGATQGQVFALYVIEGLMLGTIAVLVGPLLGLPLARLIGNASGFLNFSGGLPFDLRLTGQSYLLAAGTALLSLCAALIPALSLARRPLLAVKQSQARLTRRPVWQRFFLDVVVLAVAIYGLVVLQRQGAITSGAGTAVIGQDPLIAVAPLLFAVGGTLLLSRLLPLLAALGSAVLARLASPSTHLALQSIARAPLQPMRLVQLCALTLTLGVFAATVAGVEGSNLSDQQLYYAGAPMRIMEYDPVHKQWNTMPLADHLKLPGVRAATLALRFEATGDSANTASDGTSVNVLGIDPATARGVIWFRPDFADQPFSKLLSLLASPGPAALVSDTFLQSTGLHLGDKVAVTLTNQRTVQFAVAAAVHYFPTFDPNQTPFLIANLDYLRRASHSLGPSEAWLNVAPAPGATDRIRDVVLSWPRRIIDFEGLVPTFKPQDEPLTAGIYGVVSVGFMIALALALLGFLAYAYLMLQRRLAEFAVVRALGLSAGQLRWLLLCEQFAVLAAGILGGIAAGVLTTRLFLPYLPFATNILPPFLVVMPWSAVGQFVAAVLLVFIVVLSINVSMLLRLHLGRVLRLGDL